MSFIIRLEQSLSKTLKLLRLSRGLVASRSQATSRKLQRLGLGQNFHQSFGIISVSKKWISGLVLA